MSTLTPQLRSIVVTAIANAANLPPDDIGDDTDLVELGLDSLDFARILIDIEDGVGAEVPVEMLDHLMEIDDDAITLRQVFSLLSAWDPTQTDPTPHPRDDVIVLPES